MYNSSLNPAAISAPQMNNQIQAVGESSQPVTAVMGQTHTDPAITDDHVDEETGSGDDDEPVTLPADGNIFEKWALASPGIAEMKRQSYQPDATIFFEAGRCRVTSDDGSVLYDPDGLPSKCIGDAYKELLGFYTEYKDQ